MSAMGTRKVSALNRFGIFQDHPLDRSFIEVKEYLGRLEEFSTADVIFNDDSPLFWKNVGPLLERIFGSCGSRGHVVMAVKLHRDTNSWTSTGISFSGPPHPDCLRCPPFVVRVALSSAELGEIFELETVSRLGKWQKDCRRIFNLAPEREFVLELVRMRPEELILVLLRPLPEL